MNVLFNCTTNIVGGGLKNSAFFIKTAIEDKNFNWHFAVCRPVYNMLIEWDLNMSKNDFTIFENSPAKNLTARKKLRELVSNLNSDMVYTMAGPAYVNFTCKHLQGISNPYITHAKWSSFRLRGNYLQTIKFYGYVGFQFFYSLKATYFVFQTQYAKESFKTKSKIRKERLFVIPNAFDLSLKEYFKEDNVLESEKNNEISILCPGAAYLHKGFQFIPEIAKELKNATNNEFKFILTLPFDSKLWLEIEKESKQLDVSNYITNFGPYKYTDLKILLNECDIVFVPSLLETFSASYLEAMCARKKLVVAAKDFAREVCGNYATYVIPQNSKNTAYTFSTIFSNFKPTNEELEVADIILNNYGDQDQRFNKIIDLIKKLIIK